MSNRREYSRRRDENDGYDRKRGNNYGGRERYNQSYTAGYDNNLSDNFSGNVSNIQNYEMDAGSRVDDSPTTTLIFVDTRNVGKLIGKSGSQIRDLQDQSSATISVNDKEQSYTSNLSLF